MTNTDCGQGSTQASEKNENPQDSGDRGLSDKWGAIHTAMGPYDISVSNRF